MHCFLFALDKGAKCAEDQVQEGNSGSLWGNQYSCHGSFDSNRGVTVVNEDVEEDEHAFCR